MTNIRTRARALSAAAVAAATLAAGCKDFISTRDAINNPNFPANATAGQRLTGVEIGVEELLTGDPARTIALWMQQYAGTDRQYYLTSLYSYGEDLTNGYWTTIYEGGGLLDIRSIKTTSDAAGDSTTAGIARVLEALEIGTAADWYGDVPYSQAFDPTIKPKLDPQASIYKAVQDTLDRAIRQLNANAGAGPQAADVLYGGDRLKWARLANSLKARFYLHTAERTGTAADGTPAFDATAYQNALTAAQQGIKSGEDFRTYQSTNLNEANLLFQFATNQRPGYASPSAFYVTLLTTRNDPRLSVYFAPAAGSTTITGASNRNGGPRPGTAVFNPSGVGGAGYRWSMVGYGETQLIIAEANYRLGNTGPALASYNNERVAAGFTAATSLPTGAAGLQEIITEKYAALLQNPEIWSDYRRTCVPGLVPPTAAGTGALIPSRFLYPDVERNTNSANIPIPDNQPPRNPNDPNPCKVGTAQTSG